MNAKLAVLEFARRPREREPLARIALRSCRAGRTALNAAGHLLVAETDTHSVAEYAATRPGREGLLRTISGASTGPDGTGRRQLGPGAGVVVVDQVTSQVSFSRPARAQSRLYGASAPPRGSTLPSRPSSTRRP